MPNPGKPSRFDRRLGLGPAPQIDRRTESPRELRLRLERKSPSHLVLHVGNEFVTHNYYLLDEAIERLAPIPAGMLLEIDLSAVPYADSEALGRLPAWSRRLARKSARFVVLNPTPYVTSILEVLKIDSVLEITHRHTRPTEE